MHVSFYHSHLVFLVFYLVFQKHASPEKSSHSAHIKIEVVFWRKDTAKFKWFGSIIPCDFTNKMKLFIEKYIFIVVFKHKYKMNCRIRFASFCFIHIENWSK